MPYGPVSLQSVRSTNQRDMLALWQRASAGRLFPEITEFAPPEREIRPNSHPSTSTRKRIAHWLVVNSGTSLSPCSFRRELRARGPGVNLSACVGRQFFIMLSLIEQAAGPRITMNSTGKMNRMSGTVMIAGRRAAFSSAFIMRA